MADDLFRTVGRTRVGDRPSVALFNSSNLPSIIVANTPAIERLSTRQVAYRSRIRISIEVASDDRRQNLPMPAVEIADSHGMALTRSFSGWPPGRGGADEKNTADVTEVYGRCERSPRYMRGLRRSRIEYFDHLMGPAGRNCCAALSISIKRRNNLNILLMGGVQTETLHHSVKGSCHRRPDDLLRSQEIRLQATKLLIDNFMSAAIALDIPNVESNDTNAHG
ncbi:hypothetical protein GGD50_004406 [Rhizobium paranaense]|uniref:Uncharacterized protein n=1 Tax=Rhizobium paranaense TaxID=1650438 RepID=A0A7W8XUK2_9HYPH|nr:hypothetical protein [Rhizobium paranaense]MBB5575771.1 hypothetical protein [Rhizobium paranaense]